MNKNQLNNDILIDPSGLNARTNEYYIHQVEKSQGMAKKRKIGNTSQELQSLVLELFPAYKVLKEKHADMSAEEIVEHVFKSKWKDWDILIPNEKREIVKRIESQSARIDLEEIFEKDATFLEAYHSIRKAGSLAPDSELVGFLIDQNRYLKNTDWNDLLLTDKNRLVANVLKKPQHIHEDLTTVSEGWLLSKEQKETAKRIMAFYQTTYKLDVGPEDKIWVKVLNKMKQSVHEALLEGDEDRVIRILNHPAESHLFYGFDDLTLNLMPSQDSWKDSFFFFGLYDLAVHFTPSPDAWKADSEAKAMIAFRLLRTLVGATGASRYLNPEASRYPHLEHPQNFLGFSDVEEILLALDKTFGFKIDFPNPYFAERGLPTTRGIASYRAIQSLYQAWKSAQLAGDPSRCRLLEIGAGLGRSAYYAMKFGFKSCTIVDLPMTSVAQAHYLINTLGKDAVSLYGESIKKIHIIPPAALFSEQAHFDLVVNFDSFTEIAEGTARQYWEYIASNSSKLLSVNHEANPFTVHELYSPDPRVEKVTRMPYWLREGYVEEIIEFKQIMKS
ncbi:MAG: putative sugar O-methyltransferase [Proteobacteria bacterium]|nr:putative sugar O-methyltransferase [Pseudomonadota bacterium]